MTHEKYLNDRVAANGRSPQPALTLPKGAHQRSRAAAPGLYRFSMGVRYGPTQATRPSRSNEPLVAVAIPLQWIGMPSIITARNAPASMLRYPHPVKS